MRKRERVRANERRREREKEGERGRVRERGEGNRWPHRQPHPQRLCLQYTILHRRFTINTPIH